MQLNLKELKKAFTVGCFLFNPFGIFAQALSNQGSAAGFIENNGQIINQVNVPNTTTLFLYTGKGIKIQLRKTGYSYELFSAKNPAALQPGNNRSGNFQGITNIIVQNYRVDIDFVNANQNPEILTGQKSVDYINYYLAGKEITGVHSYEKITYKNIYKNTDIEFLILPGKKNPFKYNIILHPGANLNDVKMMIRGASEIIVSAGSLEINTPLGLIQEQIPISYYEDVLGVNQPVNFKLDDDLVSFSGKLDVNRTLVIDPSSNLIWSTYYGGSNIEYCTCTGTDGQDNVYIAGHTFSSNNIATNGSYQSVINGSLDAFIAKFNSGGFRQWASYFGGASSEQIFSMFVEASGNVYLSGDTFSPTNVASAGAHQTIYGGGIDDALLIKFSPSGIRLWSTYFGGTEHDISQAVTVDNNGNVIMTGHTQSNNLATTGSYQTVLNFGYDVFVAKFNSNGALLWCTYYGDSGVDEAYGIATDASDDVYITGFTGSISGISTPGGHQPNLGGLSDGYLAKFNTLGTSLIWGTYYGGSGDDHGNVVRIKKNGNVFIAGVTTSSNNIVTPNAYQLVQGSSDDSFLACFNINGARLWASYFGGDDTDYINDLVIDANSNLVFCGQTLSTVSISTIGAYQGNIASINNYDAFFAKFSYTGQKKLATYYGGPDNDNGRGIAVNTTGKIYLAGETSSTINISTQATHQPNPGGSQDGFLAKFCSDIEPIITPGNATLCIGNNTLSATIGYSTYLWNNGTSINPLITNNTTVQGTYQFAVYVTDGFGCSGTSDTANVVIADCFVSIQEYLGDTSARLYPVPSGDFIHVAFTSDQSEKPTLLKIYTSTGQLISEIIPTDTAIKIDITDLAPGIYILQSTCGAHLTNKKFIRE